MLQQNVSLKPYNTFGIDVTAKQYAVFNNVEELQTLLSVVDKSNILPLGGGSNLLFTSEVYNGTVLKNNIKGIEIVDETIDHLYVKAGSGEVWHQFVLFCIQNNYAGIENLSLIPGCVGASPMQNIGAYGVEIKDVFHSLEAYHIFDNTLVTFGLNDCDFGYRESVFKRKFKNQFIISSVTFKLSKTPQFKTGYGAIREELENMGVQELSIRAISDAVINIRSSKLPNPVEIGNAGSFFKNPVVSFTHYETLKTAYPEMPGYDVFEDETPVGKKLAAGWLIEKAGWKGFRRNDAGVHKLQALVLVNYADAKGAEILDLSTKIIEDIYSKFQVRLEREVNIIGA